MRNGNEYVFANLAAYAMTTGLVAVMLWLARPFSSLVLALSTIAFAIVNLFLAHRCYPRLVNPLVDWLIGVERNQAVIGLGSNIEPEANIARAIKAITAAHRVISRSKVVRTKPIGRADQPDFLNGVLRIETPMTREELEQWLKAAETRLGRKRDGDKYGPRTIDLDLVVWNGRVVHDDVRQREFLRTAVREVWPDLDMGV